MLFFVICLLFAVPGNADGQQNNVDSCKAHFIDARKSFNRFYKTKETYLLDDALKKSELSLHCPLTRIAGVELKISILSMQKQYRKGYQFIQTLNESDFKYRYRKEMGYNFLHSLESEDKGDIVSRNIYLIKAKNAVEQYIEKQNPNGNSSDISPYYDLVFIMKRMGNTQKTNDEIAMLTTKYPALLSIFNSLNSELNGSAVETKVTNPQ
jgi:hypothetical protein